MYRIEFSSLARQAANDFYDYLLFRVGGTGNPQAADHFYGDFSATLKRLERDAESYGYYYEDEKMAAIGYRKIHFSSLDYKIFYRVKGNMVYVDMICHDSQDYRKLLKRLKFK